MTKNVYWKKIKRKNITRNCINADDAINKYNIEYNNIDSNIRNALLGFTCSSISDLLTNPLRVLKLNRQSNIYSISYYDIYKNIVCEHGFLGLWGRGLFTRIFTHGIQGSVFMVFWKLLENDSK